MYATQVSTYQPCCFDEASSSRPLGRDEPLLLDTIYFELCTLLKSARTNHVVLMKQAAADHWAEMSHSYWTLSILNCVHYSSQQPCCFDEASSSRPLGRDEPLLLDTIYFELCTLLKSATMLFCSARHQLQPLSRIGKSCREV